MTTLAAGQDIQAWCLACEGPQKHVIKKINRAGRPHQVQCGNCSEVHRYRVNPPKTASKSSRTASDANEITEYERRTRGRDMTSATEYSIHGSYDVDDAILHKTLGVGLVIAIRGHRKMEVLFPSGPKLLATLR